MLKKIMYRSHNLRSAIGSKDQNISLDPTIFVDDERFLKNYNLKDLFLPQHQNKSLCCDCWGKLSSFVYHIEPTYYIVT